MSDEYLTKTRVRQVQILTALLAVVGSAPTFLLGQIALSVFLLCQAIPIAWIVSSNKERNVLSLIGLTIIIIGASIVVTDGSNKIQFWFISKLAFVVYFGIFASQLISWASGGNKKWQMAVLVCLLLLCFAFKYASQVGDESIIAVLKNVHQNNGVYGWPDFIEDVSFGLGGALAAEIAKWTDEN